MFRAITRTFLVGLVALAFPLVSVTPAAASETYTPYDYATNIYSVVNCANGFMDAGEGLGGGMYAQVNAWRTVCGGGSLGGGFSDVAEARWDVYFLGLDGKLHLCNFKVGYNPSGGNMATAAEYPLVTCGALWYQVVARAKVKLMTNTPPYSRWTSKYATGFWFYCGSC